MPETKHSIQIRIRDLRRRQAMTQEELAAALGISRQSINAMEAGRCLPSLPVALQIASFFSVPLSTVFEFTPEQVISTTAVMPWSPLSDVRQALAAMLGSQRSFPAANLALTDREVLVQLFLPGYAEEDISLEVGEDFLTVMADSPQEAEMEYERREYVPAAFQRTLELPVPVEAAGAEADLRQGILTIRLPKRTQEPPKTAKIQIRTYE